MRRSDSFSAEVRDAANNAIDRRMAVKETPGTFKVRPSTFDSLQPHPLQVFPLRTIQGNRMVRSRALTSDQVEGVLRVQTGGEHDLLKQQGIDEPRAGASQEDPVWRDELHREPIDVFIAAGRPLDVRALLREGRGIADDDVPLLPRLDATAEVVEH